MEITVFKRSVLCITSYCTIKYQKYRCNLINQLNNILEGNTRRENNFYRYSIKHSYSFI